MKKYICFFLILFVIFVTPVFAKQDIAKIYISGDISSMVDKDDVRNVRVSFSSSSINFESYATMKLQGEFSLIYPKKNYTLKLYNDKNCEDKKKVNLKWGNYYKYTLKANWTDETHSKNIVSSDIAGDINAKYGYFKNTPNNGAIDGFPVEIYVNGDFHGLYTLNLHKDYMFDDGTDREYILIGTNGSFFFNPKLIIEDENWSNFEVEVGEQNDETLAKLNRLLTFINTSSDEEFKRDLEKYFNLDSLLNYYCYVRYADLVDSVSNNLFFLTYDGEIWYTVFYDLDESFGESRASKKNYKNPRYSYISSLKLWRKLQVLYPDHIVVRYNELREDIFVEDNIMKKFNDFHDSIPKESFIKDDKVWPDKFHNSIGDINQFLIDRTPIIDDVMKSLKTSNYDEIYELYNKNNGKSNNNYVVYIVCLIVLLIFFVTFIICFIRKKRI